MLHAARLKLKYAGETELSDIIFKVSQSVGHKPHKESIINHRHYQVETFPQIYSCEEALELLVSNDFSKRQFQNLRQGSLKRNFKLYLLYDAILAAKRDAYPENLFINEIKSEVKLESLLHHTAKRLLQHLNLSTIGNMFTLVCKWGFDSSSGYSCHKQIWLDEVGSDDHLLVTSLVPLEFKDQNSCKVVWKNPRPSSTKFCRPLKLQWCQETDSVCREEEAYVKKQIAELTPFMSTTCTVFFDLHLTMVDGKVMP